ncbi:MAG: PSD1 and planctomycete cytochrome C domain-containing protein [Mariniblastus sp.]|nr:PSD1 and planctomycete cytochrome C domain-containing protein [Mariniblastus sp.]
MKTKTTNLICGLLFLALANCYSSFAQEPSKFSQSETESELLFVRRVRPIIREKCLACHGTDPENLEGSLDVRDLKALLVGGDSGEPAIIPGKPESSPFYIAASRLSDEWSPMPPKEAEQLTEQQLDWLRDWINSGAVWPSQDRVRSIELENASQWSDEDGSSVKTSGGLSEDWTNRKYDLAGLWAYQPIKKPLIESGSGLSPIDTLILNELPAGLEVAARADRRTLIRRATFDLTGLPPRPDDTKAFIEDSRSDSAAFASVIDRLLDSPHYGERMAQHWLDVSRYADSSGFANDFARGSAWRYRDYVVRSFNQDKPYDEFVREQIAGDEIADALESTDETTRRKSELFIATGFLRMGPWELTAMEVAKVARQRFLDDVTNSVGETFLGHSLQCARCHDHKFDPVPTRDYYSIQAVFSSTQLAERAVPFSDVENVEGFQERRYLKQRQQDYEVTLSKLDQILLNNAMDWFNDRGLPTDDWDQAVEQATKATRRESKSIFSSAREILRKQKIGEDKFPPKHFGFTPRQFGQQRVANKGIQRLQWELDRYRPFALAVYNGRTPQRKNVMAPTRVPEARLTQGELESTCILTGGDPFGPAEKVSPGTLSVLADQVAADLPDSIEGRRSAFAEWVADENNPLTSRVMVNRIWQWHFGEGIAGNPNNFGSSGKRPTHPELLDWLAANFVENGWSVKKLHRMIMNSDAYCRSGKHPEPAVLEEFDPLGASYATFKPRRLSAEEIRDSMLFVTGELNTKVGGIPCRPEINQEVALQPRQVMGSFASAWVPNPQPADRNRRALYVLKLRGVLDPMLEVFNAPSPDFSCEKREASTVTPQVFGLFNSENSYARALALANRAITETKGKVEENINASASQGITFSYEKDHDRRALARCFELAMTKTPSAEEMDTLIGHWGLIEKLLPREASVSKPQPKVVTRHAVEENTGEKFSFQERLYSNADYVSDLQRSDVDRHTRALADICLVLLNSNEFVYVY